MPVDTPAIVLKSVIASAARAGVLARLDRTIAARKTADPASSWTARLLAAGPEKCAEKFGEEAIEAIGDRPLQPCPDHVLAISGKVGKKNPLLTQEALPFFG